MSEVGVAGRFGRLYRLLDWPLRLVGLNLLWLLGVLAGAVVAGLSPATIALFAVLREYVRGGHPRLWHDFWRHWRAEFGRSQLRLGVPLLTVWVLVFYLLAVRGTALAAAVGIVCLVYGAVLMYVPAVVVHFDVPTVVAWRIAALTVWRAPLWTIGLGSVLVALAAAMVYEVPAAIPFFGASAPAVVITVVGARVFGSIATPAGSSPRDLL